MKEINLNKKLKVIKLFLAGYTYDEIALELGIAKGSVANIIDEFKCGKLQIAPNQYVDTLRELAVDLRKQHTTVKQLKMYVAIHQKLVEMGVGIEEVDDWLDIVQDIATETASTKAFVMAALHLAQMEIETCQDPGSLVAEFKSTSLALNNLKAEVLQTKELKEKATAELDAINQAKAAAQEQYDTQTAELKAKLDQYMAESELNWNLVTTMKAILNEELTKKGLDEEEIGKISKRIAEIGSLSASIKGLAEEKKTLEEHILGLKEDDKNLEISNTGLQKYVDQLASQAYAMMEGEKALDVQMKEIKWQLKGLKTVKASHALDIYTAWLTLAFLNDPGKIGNADFDWLVEIMNGIRMARLGKWPKQAVDAGGKVICQCQVPVPYTPIEDYGIAMDKAQVRLAEYLVPLVKDKFVPKFEYETSKLMQEITEMYQHLNSAMSGHPEKSYQPTDQPGPSEQKTTTEEMDPNAKPDEAVTADAAIPEQPAVPEGSLYYSPEAIKARWEVDNKFGASMPARTDFSIPWKDGQ